MNRLFLVVLLAIAPAMAQQSEIEVSTIPILPSSTTSQTRLTDGEIKEATVVLSKENPVLYRSMVVALRTARTRAQQEEVVLNFINPELKEQFDDRNAKTDLVRPEQRHFLQLGHDDEALQLSNFKQPFVDFKHWNSNPVEKIPAESWQDLCSSRKKSLEIILERAPSSVLSESGKAEAVDVTEKVCASGPDSNPDPDKRYSKVVNLQDVPYWEWTAGGVAVVQGTGRYIGANVKYQNGPAYGLAIFLPKHGFWIILAYPCHGNPIIPILAPITFNAEQQVAVPHKLLSCSINPPSVVLKTRGDSATFTLTTNPVFNPGEYVVDWYLQKPGAPDNQVKLDEQGQSLTLSGMQLDQANVFRQVKAVVSINGQTSVDCQAQLKYLTPTMPTPNNTVSGICTGFCQFILGPQTIGNELNNPNSYIEFKVDSKSLPAGAAVQMETVHWNLHDSKGKVIRSLPFNLDSWWMAKVLADYLKGYNGKKIDTASYSVSFDADFLVNGQICHLHCEIAFLIVKTGSSCGTGCKIGLFAVGAVVGGLVVYAAAHHGGGGSKPPTPVVTPPATGYKNGGTPTSTAVRPPD